MDTPFVRCEVRNDFAGAFAKLRKTTISFVMLVWPSAWNNLGSHWTDFHEILYLNIYRKSVVVVKVSLKLNKIPYILESNPHPNLIRTSFCRFLEQKKKLVRGSNPHLSFNRPLPTRQTD